MMKMMVMTKLVLSECWVRPVEEALLAQGLSTLCVFSCVIFLMMSTRYLYLAYKMKKLRLRKVACLDEVQL